ncbi:MAG: hypothetical protein P1U61_02670 [Legionellaceae bacterium]|nr:hypothetical protein [Legionellaceae bacterium]
MKMWLYPTDLDELSYDVEASEGTKSDDGVIAQHLHTYTNMIEHSQTPCPIEAMQPLEALLEHYPNHEALLIRLAYLRYQGSLEQDSNEALKLLNVILASHPKHEQALKLAIDICFVAERFAEALPLVTTLIECEPDEVSHFALRRRATIYHALGQSDKALADLDKALSTAVFTAAKSRREAREFMNRWPEHYLFFKQPISPSKDQIYGVIADEYTEYDESDESDACLFLKDRIEDALEKARATHAFYQPAEERKGPSVHLLSTEGDTADIQDEPQEKRRKVTRSGCGY